MSLPTKDSNHSGPNGLFPSSLSDWPTFFLSCSFDLEQEEPRILMAPKKDRPLWLAQAQEQAQDGWEEVGPGLAPPFPSVECVAPGSQRWEGLPLPKAEGPAKERRSKGGDLLAIPASPFFCGQQSVAAEPPSVANWPAKSRLSACICGSLLEFPLLLSLRSAAGSSKRTGREGSGAPKLGWEAAEERRMLSSS